MKTITSNTELVAYCGLYCGACGAYLKEKCPGCHQNEKATWCEVRYCCVEHKYSTCAECSVFECHGLQEIQQLHVQTDGIDSAIRSIGLHQTNQATGRRRTREEHGPKQKADHQESDLPFYHSYFYPPECPIGFPIALLQRCAISQIFIKLLEVGERLHAASGCVHGTGSRANNMLDPLDSLGPLLYTKQNPKQRGVV